MGEGAKAALSAFDYLIRTPAPAETAEAATAWAASIPSLRRGFGRKPRRLLFRSLPTNLPSSGPPLRAPTSRRIALSAPVRILRSSLCITCYWPADDFAALIYPQLVPDLPSARPRCRGQRFAYI